MSEIDGQLDAFELLGSIPEPRRRATFRTPKAKAVRTRLVTLIERRYVCGHITLAEAPEGTCLQCGAAKLDDLLVRKREAAE